MAFIMSSFFAVAPIKNTPPLAIQSSVEPLVPALNKNRSMGGKNEGKLFSLLSTVVRFATNVLLFGGVHESTRNK